ncbi:Rna-binding protein-like protein [Leptomonas pyrrhocoris]|uniref:Rna-binding protein-like protein n=1 Tax=Leptomonas pyrrhocoris TaxID=157538 RepID=A0A0M9G6W1_LEPPY|nr:Rna-binding protein-like protein [Leptomonas pyrrhocoris]KPA83687.1 Rna-binding protein-like protein [Leptomonas pyrrhocoris]|eukprot:XP_015662126.1 Rna-binding protein-like protein [Leptomonas pyrrhocoris]
MGGLRQQHQCDDDEEEAVNLPHATAWGAGSAALVERDRRLSGLENKPIPDALRSGGGVHAGLPRPLRTDSFGSGVRFHVVSAVPLLDDWGGGKEKTSSSFYPCLVAPSGHHSNEASSTVRVQGSRECDGGVGSEEEDDDAALQAVIAAAVRFEDFSSEDEDDARGGQVCCAGAAVLDERGHERRPISNSSSSSCSSNSRFSDGTRRDTEPEGTAMGFDARRSFFGSALGSTADCDNTGADREGATRDMQTCPAVGALAAASRVGRSPGVLSPFLSQSRSSPPPQQTNDMHNSSCSAQMMGQGRTVLTSFDAGGHDAAFLLPPPSTSLLLSRPPCCSDDPSLHAAAAAHVSPPNSNGDNSKVGWNELSGVAPCVQAGTAVLSRVSPSPTSTSPQQAGRGVCALSAFAVPTAAAPRGTVLHTESSPDAQPFSAYGMPLTKRYAEHQQRLQLQQQPRNTPSVSPNVLHYAPSQMSVSGTVTTLAATTPTAGGTGLSSPLLTTAYQLPTATLQQQQQLQQQRIAAGGALTPIPSATTAADAATSCLRSTRASRNLYFRNLPSSWNTTVLKELCGDYGVVLSAKVAHHPVSNKPLGYGFVLFERERSAAVCMAALNHALIRTDGEEPQMLLVRMAHQSATPGFQEDPSDAAERAAGERYRQPLPSPLQTGPLSEAVVHRGSFQSNQTPNTATPTARNAAAFATTDIIGQPTSVPSSPYSRFSGSASGRPLSPLSVITIGSGSSSAVIIPEPRPPATRPTTTTATSADGQDSGGEVRHGPDRTRYQRESSCWLCAAATTDTPRFATAFASLASTPMCGLSATGGDNSSCSALEAHYRVRSNAAPKSQPPPLPRPYSPSLPPPPSQHQQSTAAAYCNGGAASTAAVLHGALASPFSRSLNGACGLLSHHPRSASRGDGATLLVSPPSFSSSTTAASTSTRNLYITNLPLTWNTAKLRDLCARFGPIVSAKVAYHPTTNESRGYGFVLFADERDAVACVRRLHRFRVPDSPNVLGCCFAKNKATPFVAHVTSSVNAPSFSLSDTTSPRAEGEASPRGAAKGALSTADDSSQNGLSLQDIDAVRGSSLRTLLASSGSLKDAAAFMPIEVFSTLQATACAQGVRHLMRNQ